jgi:hypothetical protein
LWPLTNRFSEPQLELLIFYRRQLLSPDAAAKPICTEQFFARGQRMITGHAKLDCP